MTFGPMDVTAPAVALAGLYLAVIFLLLSLHLKSAWSWPIKSGAIGLALPATIGAFLTIQAQLGWPSQATLPSTFQLHAALVDEPALGQSDGGAIFLWLTPWDQKPDADVADDVALNERPRAFDLPYSRELHQQVQSMQERLARGEMVVGRHAVGQSWQRRFGTAAGTVDLDIAPPLPPPAKEG